jgi:hypothetical protein
MVRHHGEDIVVALGHHLRLAKFYKELNLRKHLFDAGVAEGFFHDDPYQILAGITDCPRDDYRWATGGAQAGYSGSMNITNYIREYR